MDLAPSPSQAPEENQLTECVAWLVAHSSVFAREFCELFLAGGERGKMALKLATRFAVDTRVTLPHPSGKGVLFPDLLVCGDACSFELIVEVKAGSTPHSYLDGSEAILQPDMYARAWRALPPASQADQLFVGTLTNNFDFPVHGDSIRVGDITWKQVCTLLSGMLVRDELDREVRLVARDLQCVIEERVLAAAGELPSYTQRLLEGARPLIDDASVRLAQLLPGGKPRQPAQIQKDYTGRYIEFTAPEGMDFELWLFATVAGGQYNVFGMGDLVVATISAGTANDPSRLLAAGFQKRTTLSRKWADWRIWVPVDHVDGEITDPNALLDAFVGTTVAALGNGNPPYL
jgi:hypothetical protein